MAAPMAAVATDAALGPIHGPRSPRTFIAATAPAWTAHRAAPIQSLTSPMGDVDRVVPFPIYVTLLITWSRWPVWLKNAMQGWDVCE